MERTAKIILKGKREGAVLVDEYGISEPQLHTLLFASIRRTITIPSTITNTGFKEAAIRRAVAKLSNKNYLSTFRNLKRAGEVKHYRITGVGRRMINKYLDECKAE